MQQETKISNGIKIFQAYVQLFKNLYLEETYIQDWDLYTS